MTHHMTLKVQFGALQFFPVLTEYKSETKSLNTLWGSGKWSLRTAKWSQALVAFNNLSVRLKGVT